MREREERGRRELGRDKRMTDTETNKTGESKVSKKSGYPPSLLHKDISNV